MQKIASGFVNVTPAIPSRRSMVAAEHEKDAYVGSTPIHGKILTAAMALAISAGVHAEGQPVQPGASMHIHHNTTSQVFHHGRPLQVESLGKATAGFTDYVVRDGQGQVIGYSSMKGGHKPQAEDLQFYNR